MHDSKQNPPLRGIIPALITPMDKDGTIDFHALEKQIDYLSNAGVNGFFICGTTSEGPYLSTAEKKSICACLQTKLSSQKTKKEQFVCFACIQPSTQAVITEMQDIEHLKPDYIVVVTPYYYQATQSEIYEHFKTIQASTTVPIILYNIPGNTHNTITYETIIKLAKLPNIAGLKDSSGNFCSFSRGLLNGLRDFAWIQGEDLLDAPSLMMGALAVVTGLGNVRIEPYINMYQAARDYDLARIKKSQNQIYSLYKLVEMNAGRVIPVIKAATGFYGRGTKWLRNNIQSLSDQETAKLAQAIEALPF